MQTYPIGRASVDVELHNNLTLQVEYWYPAANSSGTPDYLFSKPLKAKMVEHIGMPSMAISTKEKGKGVRGAAPAEGSWPLVIFNHGFASFSRQNNRQAEALATAGYVVASISHPGESLTTEYADGGVVPINPDHPALKYIGKESDKSVVSAAMKRLNEHFVRIAGSETSEQYLDNMNEMAENTIFKLYRESAEQRRDALILFVKQLVAGTKTATTDEHSIQQAIDTQHIALYGHSLGGIVSVAAAEHLQKLGVPIRAAVNLDAPQFLLPVSNAQNTTILTVPTCFLMGGSTKGVKSTMHGTQLNSSWAQHSNHVCEINIAGAAHNNFTDLSWVSILKWFGQLGPVPNKKFGNWLNGFLVAYFNHHVKDRPFNYPLWRDAELVGKL